MLTFERLHDRARLRHFSPLIQRGIEAIHGRGMSQDTSYGDVYVALVSGQLSCTIFGEGSDAVGFYLSEVQPEHNGDLTLYLAYVYVAPARYDLTPEVVDSFEREAVERGCARIRFKTVRDGWLRRLEPYGYHSTAIELSKDIGG